MTAEVERTNSQVRWFKKEAQDGQKGPSGYPIVPLNSDQIVVIEDPLRHIKPRIKHQR